MGGACCIAARDKNIVHGPGSDILHRNIRHSPSWSFRWDNRGRVAGEDTSISWFSNGTSGNDESAAKYGSTYASEDGSPTNSAGRHTLQKSPVSDRIAGHVTTPASGIWVRSLVLPAALSPSPSVSDWYSNSPALGILSFGPVADGIRQVPYCDAPDVVFFVSDQSISRNASMETNLEPQTEQALATSYQSTSKLSLSLPSTSSMPTSPTSTQNQLLPSSSNRPSWACHSPGHQSAGQASDCQNSGLKRPSNGFTGGEDRSTHPSWSNESTRGSHGGSSDSWSMIAFSELMATSHREGWSFDTQSMGSHRGRTRGNSQISASSSMDLQACGICLKLLTDRSLWSGQKLIANNELPVVAILTCGHVYHAECLETLTHEMTKYDPCCPICTLGEKQTLKLSEKAMKAELEMKAKKKKSRKRVVDSDVDGDSSMLDNVKPGREGKGPKLGSSSSMKSPSSKAFLRRHFSFGSKASRSLSENQQLAKKKGFFWTRSMKG
ncbi:hypothetical protein LINPERHAP1_LOCUS19335 [Linum perenne]